MERHIRIISLIYIIYGFMLFVSGLFNVIAQDFFSAQLALLNQHAINYPATPLNLPNLLNIIYILDTQLSLIISLPALFGGFGLFNHRSWGRMTLMTVSVFMLFNMPIGSLVGLYSLWILSKPETVLVVKPQTI